MTGAVDVTITIVNHENRDGVLASLRALEEDHARDGVVQVIVVDNASEDGSAAAIRDAFPFVELIEQRRRCGFGANHNAALGKARGRHVLLLNDDAVVRPGAVDALAAHLDAHPEAALAAPRILNVDGATQASAWELPAPARDLLAALTLGRRPRPLSAGPAPRRVGWALGCALLARRDALLAVGGFDEGYFMYSEEVDLARRLAERGLATHWVPDAVVAHAGQVSTGGHISVPRAVEMARSRRRYWEHNYSSVGFRLAQLATSAQFVALGLLSLPRGEAARAFFTQAVVCWSDGSRHGLRELATEWNHRAPAGAAAGQRPEASPLARPEPRTGR